MANFFFGLLLLFIAVKMLIVTGKFVRFLFGPVPKEGDIVLLNRPVRVDIVDPDMNIELREEEEIPPGFARIDSLSGPGMLVRYTPTGFYLMKYPGKDSILVRINHTLTKLEGKEEYEAMVLYQPLDPEARLLNFWKV